MDINCGDILEGVTIQDKGREILDEILAVASGKAYQVGRARLRRQRIRPLADRCGDVTRPRCCRGCLAQSYVLNRGSFRSMQLNTAALFLLPSDHNDAVLVGRIWRPDKEGPSVVAVRRGKVVDISGSAPTMRDLCEMHEPAALAVDAAGEPVGLLDDIAANTPRAVRNPSAPWLLAPTDLQAIKAAGVTFVASMLERVIEERAGGVADRAATIRQDIAAVIGDDLRQLKPGSPEAMALKDLLIARNMWSQYLEVRYRPRRRVFHQGSAAVGGGSSRRSRYPPDVVVEQSRTGGRPGSRILGHNRRRRHLAMTSIFATSKAAPLCSSARPRTTMQARRSARSFDCSTTGLRSTMCVPPTSR